MGDVTLRMWPVGGHVVLATSETEAEQSLVSLVGHPDATVRAAAVMRLGQLRASRAAAA